MESTWPEAHRRDDDPQQPQFRAFALPRIFIARWTPRKEREGNDGRRVQTVPRQHSRAVGLTHTYAHTCMYIHPVHAYKRDCIYAESYLPRLKSHRGESRGRSALGIASARVVIPPRCSSLPSALLSLRFAAHPRGSLPAIVHRHRRMQMHR